MVKPTKDAVKQVRKYLVDQYGLTIRETIRSDGKAPGHLTIDGNNTVIHVKGVQQASETSSNAYFPRNLNELRNGETNFLVLVYKDINNSFILPKEPVEKIFGGLKPNLGHDRKERFVYRVVSKNGRHFVKCSSRGGTWVDIEDYRNKWDQIPEISGKPLMLSDREYCLMLHLKDDSNWDDREGTAYSYGDNVPNQEKIQQRMKVVFFYRSNGKIILRGHGMIRAVVNLGFLGRTTPTGKQIEDKVGQVHCYDRFIPHKTLPNTLENEITSQKSYNGQYSIVEIPKSLFNRLIQKDSYSMQELEKTTSLTAKTFAEWESILNEKKQAIIYGPPGTGKTFVASEFAKYISAKYGGRYDVIQFHPSYSYEDFIEGIKPKLVKGNITYEPTDGTFKEFCKCAARADRKDAKYILLIDEINRGNLSKIFGELIYSLEYRGLGREVILPYTKELFTIPDNVWIIGTMNSADRSIAVVDYALRRRFYFIDFMPSVAILTKFLDSKSVTLNKEERKQLVNMFNEVNLQISSIPSLGPQCQIGHSYFMRENLSIPLIRQIWKYAVKPILEEYFFENPNEAQSLGRKFDTAFPEEKS